MSLVLSSPVLVFHYPPVLQAKETAPRSFMKPKAKRTPPTAATNIAAAGLPPRKLSKRNCKPIIGNTNEPKPIKIRVTPHSFIENPFTYYFSATLVPDRFKSSSHEPKNQ